MRRIVVVTKRKSKTYGRSSIRGNHMNLGIPSAPGFVDGLRSVFLEPLVPSGRTFTEVESIENTSILVRTICSTCSCSKTRSNTPFFAHRFKRI